MTKTYRYFIVADWTNKGKNGRVQATNPADAIAEIKARYPKWQLSMFWVEWKP